MKRLLFLTVFIVMIAGSGQAYGCSCAPPEGPDVALLKTDAVFIGEAIKKKKHRTHQLYEVTFKVERKYKGDFDDEVVIRTAMHGASCGFAFVKNQKYLVYAYEHKGEFRGFFSTGICSRTKSLSEAAEDLLVLDSLYEEARENKRGLWK